MKSKMQAHTTSSKIKDVTEIDVASVFQNLLKYDKTKKPRKIPTLTRSMSPVGFNNLRDARSKERYTSVRYDINSGLYSMVDYMNYCIIELSKKPSPKGFVCPNGIAYLIDVNTEKLSNDNVEKEEAVFKGIHKKLSTQAYRFKGGGVDGYFYNDDGEMSMMMVLVQENIISQRFYMRALGRIKDTKILDKHTDAEKRCQKLWNLLVF